ncbi:MAG: hypothetical protein ACREX3_05480 [Gammaproteobacteria bacterium]
MTVPLAVARGQASVSTLWVHGKIAQRPSNCTFSAPVQGSRLRIWNSARRARRGRCLGAQGLTVSLDYTSGGEST